MISAPADPSRNTNAQKTTGHILHCIFVTALAQPGEEELLPKFWYVLHHVEEHGALFIFGLSYHRSLHLFAHSQCPNMLFAGYMLVYESLVLYGLR